MWFAILLPAVLAHVFSLPASHANFTFPPSSALSFLPIIYGEQFEHLSSFKCIPRDTFCRTPCLQGRPSTRQVVTRHRMLPINSLHPLQVNASLLTSTQEYRLLLEETLISPPIRCPAMQHQPLSTAPITTPPRHIKPSPLKSFTSTTTLNFIFIRT